MTVGKWESCLCRVNLEDSLDTALDRWHITFTRGFHAPLFIQEFSGGAATHTQGKGLGPGLYLSPSLGRISQSIDGEIGRAHV